MKSRARFWDYGLFALVTAEIITSRRTDDHLWLATHIGVMISFAITVILGIYCPEPTTLSKAAKTTLAIVVGVSLSLDFSRQFPNAITEHVVPSALQINPSQAAQGQTLEVTITTTSSHFTDGSIPHFGPGITVLDNHTTSETALAAHVEIDASTATGFRRIWVSTPGKRTAVDDSPRGAFSVFAAGK